MMKNTYHSRHITSKLKIFLFIAAFFAVSGSSYGQLAIPSSTPVTQNFDGMGSSATAALPTGFVFNTSASYSTGVPTSATTQAAGTTGAGILSGVSSGGNYNLANGITASSTDRAIGVLNSGGFTSPRTIVLAIQNTGATNITDLAISFDYEKYRSGTRQFDWTFFHGSNAVAVNTAATAGDQTYVADANNTTIFNPPTTSSKSFTLTGLNIAPTGMYYICWTYTGLGGSSNGQGTGIDNLSLIATFVPAGITTAANTDWFLGSTWTGGIVPTSGQSVVIQHNITGLTAVTRDAGTTTTINVGSSLAMSATYTNNGTTTVNGTFQIDGGGYGAGNNFVYGAASSLTFNSGGNYGVNATDAYWPTAAGSRPYNVNVLSGGIVMASGAAKVVDGIFTASGNSGLGVSIGSGATLTLNGTCRINSGGYFANTGSPIYGAASTLLYNTGGTYGRYYEWNAAGVGTIGTTPGYPNNVQLSSSTVLNYTNLTPVNIKAMAGNLTVDLGSALNMDYGGIDTAGSLVVAGNVTVAGALRLGTVLGDDLKMGGNLAFTGTGSLAGNNRAIFFTKNGTQTISSVAALDIPYVVLLPTSGATKVQLLCNLTVSAATAGPAMIFTNATDIFDLNGFSINIGTAGVANTITGTGTFSGTSASNMTLKGLGSIGTLNFTSGFQNLGTLTMDREFTKIGCTLGTPLTINTAVILTNGLLNVGNNPLTIVAAGTITSSSTNYIIADLASGSSASLRRGITAAGPYLFPIGDLTGAQGTPHYTPVTATFTGGSYPGGSYAGFAVDDIKEPNLDASSYYITRYWSMTSSGMTPTSYSVTGTYLPADIVGTENVSHSNQWNGTAWTNGGGPIGLPTNAANTMTIGGCTTQPAVNHFTGGYRDPEINVQQSGTNYLTTQTYDFGTHLTGSSTPITFTIQNLGQQNLTLAGATFTGGPNYVYTTAYPATVAPLGSQTFVITFSPSTAGTLTGSISIPNNDASGAENPYIINFTGIGVVPAPEINIKGFTGGTNSITSGNIITVNPLENTSFGTAIIGASITKDFEIQNTGQLVLNLTGAPLVNIGGTNPGDFTVTTVPSTNAIAAASSTTFIITFIPLAIGTRSAIVSIANNDINENPYTYLIQGTGTCDVTTNTITPTSGPIGTEVIVNATSNNLTGATVSFNGVAATVTQISSTQIKVIVPAGAVSGNLITTNSQGCSATNAFTIISNAGNSCQGGTVATDLFMSEVTDASSGGLTYVEIYNGTGATVNLSTYSVKTANNGGAYGASLPLSNVNLATGSTYVVAFGSDSACGVPGGDGSYAAQSIGGGINFTVGGNDHFGLFKAAVLIDSFGTFGSGTWADLLGIGDRGATFRRKNTVVSPNPTYSNTDWNITDWVGTLAASCPTNDYSDIGTYNFISGTPPTVTTQPTYTPTCKATSLTVAGTEGFAGGNALAYQWYVVAPNVATWTALTNAGIYSGTTSATLVISNVAGLDGYQFYCQIRENGVACYTASNAVKVTDAQTVTWNGSTWSPNPPTISSIVVINGNYNTTTNGSFECCSMTINSGSTVTVTGNQYVSIQNDLTVSAGGNLVVQNQGSLVMVDDLGVVANSGSTQVQKTTASYDKYDYTYWSSPIAGNTIGSTFSTWRTDYSFTFNTVNFADLNNDTFDDAAPYAWTNTGTAAVMTAGKGYAIMAPTVGTFPTTSSVVFSGAANNGVITLPVALSGNGADANDDYNLIGNPYASALSANAFILGNAAISGTLYFWTHVSDISVSNPGPNTQNFISDDYAVYNLTGGTRASNTGSPVPNGFISSGQGFLVEAAAAGNVTFNNSMRNKTYNNAQFFRNANAQTSPIDKDRIWLNLQNQDGMFSQQLIGYFNEATSGIDRGYDGIVNSSHNYISFYSFIGNEKFRVQGRPTFDINDRVSLGYSSVVAGTFNINIDNREGALNGTATDIYLEDRLLNVIHDLKQGPYSFTTAIGTFDDRFVLRYTNTALGNTNFEVNDTSVVVAANDTKIKIKSDNELIKAVTIYDVLGRTILQANEVGSRSFATDKVTAHQQALIVRITLDNQQVVVRKIIF